MRKLLVITIVFSVVSSEDFEPRKRLQLPPDVDPNFWPVRGRRSHWDITESSHGNTIQNVERPEQYIDQDASRYSDVEYARYPKNSWKIRSCSRRASYPFSWMSYPEVGMIVRELPCNERCPPGRNRRDDENWIVQKPLYVDEPRWITIDYNGDSSGKSSLSMDPFFVTRGKKLVESMPINPRNQRNVHDVYDDLKTADPFYVTRGKRFAEERVNEMAKGSRPEVNDRSAKSLENDRNKLDVKFSDVESHEPPSHDELVDEPDNKFSGNRRQKRSKESNDSFENNSALKKSEEQRSIDVSLTKVLNDWTSNEHQRATASDFLFPSISGNQRNDGMESAEEFDPETRGEHYHLGAVHPRRREKHSNLQSIPRDDDPFFVSRGKKSVAGYLRDVGTSSQDLPIVVPSSLGEKVDEGISGTIETERKDEDGGNQMLVPSSNHARKVDREGRLVQRYQKSTFDSGRSKNFDLGSFDEAIGPYSGIRIKKTKQKPPRNRRGMLDDLLNEDDPFYVARGKKSIGKSREEPSLLRYFNGLENTRSVDDERFSEFLKFIRAMRSPYPI